MSLLSGIKFVPRDKKKSSNRERSPSPVSRSDSEDESEKKRISRFKEKKSKESHSSRRKRSYSLSSESDVDLDEIIKEEVKEDRKRRYDSRERRNESRERRNESRERRNDSRERRNDNRKSRYENRERRDESREKRNDSKRYEYSKNYDNERRDQERKYKDSRVSRSRSRNRSRSRSRSRSRDNMDLDKENYTEKSSLDKEKLTNMLFSLKSFNNNINNNTQVRTLESDINEKDNSNDLIKTEPSSTNELKEISRPSTNQGVAALLRAKLKTTQGVVRSLDLPKTSNIPTPLTSTTSDMDLDVRKQMLILQKQFNLNKGNQENGEQNVSKDIELLLFKEKYNKDEEDIDKIYRENILKLGKHYKGTEFNSGDKAGKDEDIEIDMKLFQRKQMNSLEQMKKQLESKEKEKAIYSSILRNCNFCKNIQNQYIIYQNENLIVKFKNYPYSLAFGHVEIIPKTHVKTFINCSEEIKEDIIYIKKKLAKYFETLESSLISFETCLFLDKFPHTVIEVIPIKHELLVEAYMYFKEAFLSSDDEWTQHRKVIELTKDRPLERAIPSNFSYLTVDWISSSSSLPCTGLVHPVETDSNYSHSFCYDVAASILEEDPYKMRKGKYFDPNEQDRDIQRLKNSFSSFI